MRSALVSTLLLLTAARASADAPARSASIIAGAYDGAALEQLTELGDRVGPRVTGSAGYAKAVTWARAKLTKAGAQNVHVETFKIPHGWTRGTARARVLGEAGRLLTIVSLGWSPSTRGAVQGPVVFARDLQKLPAAADVKGAIVVLAPSGARAANAYMLSQKAYAAFAAAGAKAVLVQGRRINGVLGVGSPPAGEMAPLPVASLAREDGEALARAAAKGSVRVEVELTNKITGPVEVASVIGELTGTDRPSEWILLGGHLDSWDLATGAQDNGSGVVSVIQTARLLASAGPLKRSVRFALWAGEEQGLLGARAYTLAHESELGTCVVALNTDNGAGHVQGWKVEGRVDVRAALEPLAKSVLAPLGGGELSLELSNDTDHYPFLIAGVPALDLLTDMGSYDDIHHTSGDTIDKVDAHALASGIAVLASTVYALASTTTPVGPRLDRAAVEALIGPENVAALKYSGWWK